MKRQYAATTPSRTVVTSFNPKTTAAKQQLQEDYFEDGDWVLCVTSGPQWISCALSNGELHVYDRERLHPIQTWYDPEKIVTELQRYEDDPNSIFATAVDGTLSLFDIRQQQNTAACQWKLPRAPEEEALSISVGFGGNICAVGSSKAKVHFFDVRQTRTLLGTYDQNHTGEVTRVRFQKVYDASTATTSTTPLLVSAGEDGIACLYDTSQPSEETALASILTVQSPIREVNFFGPQSEGIYCLTGSESLLLYHKDSAICQKDFGAGFRNNLSQLVMTSQQSNNNTSLGAANSGGQQQQQAFPVDYLVDCHWDTTHQELKLLAGSAKGDAAVFSVNEGGTTLRQSLLGGHRGVLRAWEPPSKTNNIDTFVTVGEDARMCEWNDVSSGTGVTVDQTSGAQIPLWNQTTPAITWPADRSRARNGGGKVRRPRSRLAATPY